MMTMFAVNARGIMGIGSLGCGKLLTHSDAMPEATGGGGLRKVRMARQAKKITGLATWQSQDAQTTWSWWNSRSSGVVPESVDS
jgi:hypothetical protein